MSRILIKMIPEKGKPVLWEELSWKDIENLTKTMKMVIMPIGACEQHGPHLPLAVDTIDCHEIAKRAKNLNPALLEIHSPQSIIRGATAGGGIVTTPAFDSGMKTALLTVTLPNGKTFVVETTFF